MTLTAAGNPFSRPGPFSTRVPRPSCNVPAPPLLYACDSPFTPEIAHRKRALSTRIRSTSRTVFPGPSSPPFPQSGKLVPSTHHPAQAFPLSADTTSMFETSTSTPFNPFSAGMAASPVRPLPVELEREFAEMQAASPAGGTLPGLLGAGLLFHLLLIAERAALHLSPAIFAIHGGPITLLLLLGMLLPTPLRHRAAGRAFLVGLAALLVVALLAGLPYTSAAQLLPMQTGVAILVLMLGSLAALPRGWTALAAGTALLADAASLLLGPAPHTLGLPVIFESFWAPGFAAVLLVLLAQMRYNEARRDFVLLRQAVFAGNTPAPADAETSRHLDPLTGVANRTAFDMRLRAAWDGATVRRHSVALLFFSIDNLPEQKRDFGAPFAELLQKQVAELLKGSLRRADDIVARFDSHHFVVMLPGVGTDGVTQIAERLRGCIEEMAVYAGQKRHHATVTVGAASLRAKRATPRERLVDCAVQALEQARATGTNLVCVEGRGCIPRMS